MNAYPEISEDDLIPTETEILTEDKLAEGEDIIGRDVYLALWATEASRRLEELRSGAAKAIPVEEAFASIRRELGL